MWEIFARCERPYHDMQTGDIVDALKRGERLKKYTKHGVIEDKAYALMRECWNRNPIERPTFAEIKPILEDHFHRLPKQ